MLKAMMIITMVSGATYEVKLPTMEQCMAQRSPVEGQSDVASDVFHELMKMPRELFKFNGWMFLQVQEQKQWTEPCNKRGLLSTKQLNKDMIAITDSESKKNMIVRGN